MGLHHLFCMHLKGFTQLCRCNRTSSQQRCGTLRAGESWGQAASTRVILHWQGQER